MNAPMVPMRVREIATQAWRRIAEMNHEPVLAIADAIQRALEEAPNRVVGRSQRLVVDLLRRTGQARLKAIAAVLGKTPSATSSVIRRLQRAGHIERRRRGMYALVVTAAVPAAVAS